VDTVLVLEDGYPFVERQLRGLLPGPLRVRGRESGDLPPDGELTPDLVRDALRLPEKPVVAVRDTALPARPPQLCRGCPHRDTYAALNRALEGVANTLVTSDIGCYTLGILPPYDAGESCVCMGASIGMAKGVAEAGLHRVVAVIGDSTFLHSGVPPLMDAVAANTDMTVLVLDNQTVAMTGTQPTVLPTARLEEIALGVGVAPEHCHVVRAHPQRIDELAAVIRGEIEHRGVSVVISVRECLEATRRHKEEKARSAS
jgi:indolepyruvate ferredoxin oxidoreductase alpha subunit